MLIPVWCPHCRMSLGDKIEAWLELRPDSRHESVNRYGNTSKEILEALGITKICCKTVMVTGNILIHTLNQYKRPQIHPK